MNRTNGNAELNRNFTQERTGFTSLANLCNEFGSVLGISVGLSTRKCIGMLMRPMLTASSDTVRMHTLAVPVSGSGAAPLNHVLHIPFLCAEVKVVGIDARTNITGMQDEHPFGDRTVGKFIRTAMGKARFSAGTVPPLKQTIASILRNGTLPQPTSRLINILSKPFSIQHFVPPSV